MKLFLHLSQLDAQLLEDFHAPQHSKAVVLHQTQSNARNTQFHHNINNITVIFFHHYSLLILHVHLIQQYRNNMHHNSEDLH